MIVTLESIKPTAGKLSIEIKISTMVNVTAFSARQKVTGFVIDEISTNMHGADPTLIIGEHVRWRVPVILSMIPYGDLGSVGAIDVDVDTGQLQVDSTVIQEIIRHAEDTTRRLTPPPEQAQ